MSSFVENISTSDEYMLNKNWFKKFLIRFSGPILTHSHSPKAGARMDDPVTCRFLPDAFFHKGLLGAEQLYGQLEESLQLVLEEGRLGRPVPKGPGPGSSFGVPCRLTSSPPNWTCSIKITKCYNTTNFYAKSILLASISLHS